MKPCLTAGGRSMPWGSGRGLEGALSSRRGPPLRARDPPLRTRARALRGADRPHRRRRQQQRQHHRHLPATAGAALCHPQRALTPRPRPPARLGGDAPGAQTARPCPALWILLPPLPPPSPFLALPELRHSPYILSRPPPMTLPTESCHSVAGPHTAADARSAR